MIGAMRALLLGVFLVGCNGTSGGHDGGEPDTPMGPPGLNVAWSARPSTIPGAVTDKIMITSATFRPQILRVIGDAGPGDTRTTQLAFELAWSSSKTPATINFPSAPTGLYSEILVEIDGLFINYSYELKGTVHRDSDNKTWDFYIHDRNNLEVSITSLGVTLDPGAAVTIPIRVDFEHALTSINYDQLTVSGTTLELDTSDSQMDNFRSALAESFRVSGPDG